MQKRLSSTGIWSAASAQNFGAAITAVIAMSSIGNAHWDGSSSLWAALSWAVIGTSVLASTLLVWMVRHGEATKVTALMLLVPPLAALQGYFLFRETLSPLAAHGIRTRVGRRVARAIRRMNRRRSSSAGGSSDGSGRRDHHLVLAAGWHAALEAGYLRGPPFGPHRFPLGARSRSMALCSYTCSPCTRGRPPNVTIGNPAWVLPGPRCDRPRLPRD